MTVCTYLTKYNGPDYLEITKGTTREEFGKMKDQVKKESSGNIFCAIDDDGYYVSHNAARVGNVTLLRYIIEHGDKSLLNVRDKTGYTPLLHAVENNQKEAAEVLLELGASVDMATTAKTLRYNGGPIESAKLRA